MLYLQMTDDDLEEYKRAVGKKEPDDNVTSPDEPPTTDERKCTTHGGGKSHIMRNLLNFSFRTVRCRAM